MAEPFVTSHNHAFLVAGSSSHSYHSHTALTVKLPVALKAAEAHIQKMTFAPTMTVNSQAVNLRLNTPVAPATHANGYAAQTAQQRLPNGQLINGQLLSNNYEMGAVNHMSTNGSPDKTYSLYYNLHQPHAQNFSTPSQPLNTRPRTAPPSHQFITASSRPTTVHLQPQFAEALSPSTTSHSTQKQLTAHQVDHTYANIETLSSVVYSHASSGSAGGASVTSAGSAHTTSPLPLSVPPYVCPSPPAAYGASRSLVQTPAAATGIDVVVNRPNRSYSQVLPAVSALPFIT